MIWRCWFWRKEDKIAGKGDGVKVEGEFEIYYFFIRVNIYDINILL